jgi:hypothetical protein
VNDIARIPPASSSRKAAERIWETLSMRKQFMLAGIVVFLSSTAALAQPGDQYGGDDDDLRSQIQALERKLAQRRKVDHNKVGGSGERVTEIGSGGPSRPWQPAPQESLVVRIYDLSDLFAVAPAYYARQSADLDDDQLIFDRAQGALGGGMGGFGGGGFFAVRPETMPAKMAEPLRQVGNNHAGDTAGNLGGARTSLDDLMKSITQSISPEDWKENGGRGTIARLGNNLMVSTTARSHEQIENLFTLFRKRWGSLRTVSLNAHWLWLTDEQIADATGGKGGGFGKVTDEAWQALREQAKQFERGGYHAMLTCYNGQTVSTVAGGQRRFIRKVSPLEVGSDKDGKSVFGYETQTGIVQDGAALQVTPLTTSGGKIVVLDVHTRVNRFAEPERDKPAPRAGKAAAEGQAEVVSQLVAAVDRPQLNSYRLATTLRVPINETVLIGGMSASGEPEPGEPGLYLFVHLAVQELRDEEPAAPPVVPAEVGQKSEGGGQKSDGAEGEPGRKQQNDGEEE